MLACDFGESVKTAMQGDLVYFDPPYVTGHSNNGFIEYNQQLFSWDDQIRLAKVARELINRGVKVIISNANHNGILQLYRGFTITSFSRFSTIASEVSNRKRIMEVLIFS